MLSLPPDDLRLLFGTSRCFFSLLLSFLWGYAGSVCTGSMVLTPSPAFPADDDGGDDEDGNRRGVVVVDGE